MSDFPLRALWTEVDRAALCVHRPSGSNPEFREVVRHLQIPAGSVLASAARHLAAGRVSFEQLELLSRYESRSLVRLNAQRHVELGLLIQVAEDEFVPSEPFAAAAQTVLDVQGRAAEGLWTATADVTDVLGRAAKVVAAATASLPVPAPAFVAQLADHGTTPSTAAGQLLAYVTELRYLRSDLHSHALGAHRLAGPTARAVDRLWKGHLAADQDLERLKRKRLVEKGLNGWRLTDSAREARNQAELDTDALTSAALAGVSHHGVAALQQGLARLPGDDPRPPEAR